MQRFIHRILETMFLVFFLGPFHLLLQYNDVSPTSLSCESSTLICLYYICRKIQYIYRLMTPPSYLILATNT